MEEEKYKGVFQDSLHGLISEVPRGVKFSQILSWMEEVATVENANESLVIVSEKTHDKYWDAKIFLEELEAAQEEGRNVEEILKNHIDGMYYSKNDK